MINYDKRAKTPTVGPPSTVATKVTLSKQSPTVSLTKHGVLAGRMRVNLHWNAATAPTRGWRAVLGTSQGLDLDLGCLWELTDGSKGVVQALGNAFGSLERPPYIHLDGDDRSGSVAGGENLFIDLNYAAQIRRVLIFAYIYEGAPSWDQARGVVTLSPAAGPPIEIHLDENAGGARFCVVAQLVNSGSDLTVKREVNYISGSQSTVDRAYGWGLNWSAGSK